jgi:cytidylate kinase
MRAVAIDGPAGAGKSTVARAVARRLGWTYVDTGAMYRAVALEALRRGVDVADGGRLGELARALRIDLGETIAIDHEDVTERIRGDDVTRAVSQVAAHPEVRSSLVDRQAQLARTHAVVMEGRDIGATVMPEAPVKIFLTASAPVRALRRARQLGLPEDPETLAEVEQSLRARDAADSTRRTSPLVRAPGAVTIDSSDKDVDEVVRIIVDEATSD